MKKSSGIVRTKNDLQKELLSQILLLQVACDTYDQGIDVSGKHIKKFLDFGYAQQIQFDNSGNTGYPSMKPGKPI
jgi:hypothetical protein